jgi:hypothetical protein
MISAAEILLTSSDITCGVCLLSGCCVVLFVNDGKCDHAYTTVERFRFIIKIILYPSKP